MDPRGGKSVTLRLACAVASLITLSIFGAACQSDEEDALVRTIGSIAALSIEEAVLATPVEFTAVVTLYDERSDVVYVQDSTGGTAVYSPPGGLETGDIVRVAGRTTARYGLPGVSAKTVSSYGRGELPPAIQIEDLDDSATWHRRVKLRGHVLETVATPSHPMIVKLSTGRSIIDLVQFKHYNYDRKRLLDSIIEVDGVATPWLDGSGNVANAHVSTVSADRIRILKPGEVSPFASKITPLNELANAENSEISNSRVHAFGAVVDISSTRVTLSDGSAEILVPLRETSSLALGDSIHASGYFEHADSLMTMSEVLILRGGVNVALKRITSIKEVKELSSEEAAVGLPVDLDARFTFIDHQWDLAFVADETGGIFIFRHPDDLALFDEGDIVRIQGATSPGDYAPVLLAEKMTKVGQAISPPPRPTTTTAMLAGEPEGDWVSVEGVVRDFSLEDTGPVLRLDSFAYPLEVLFPTDEPVNLSVKAGSTVRVTGVSGTLFNRNRQMTGVRIWSPGPEHVDIIAQAPSFSETSRVPIRELGTVGPGRQHGDLAKITGVVTFVGRSPSLIITDESGAVPVSVVTSDTTRFHVGQVVTATGFVHLVSGLPRIDDAVTRVVGIAEDSMPVPLVPRHEMCEETDVRNSLVSMEATLVNRLLINDDLKMVMESGGFLFPATLETYESNRRLPEVGSTLQITGICASSSGFEAAREQNEILLRSAEDLSIVRPPVFWTTKRSARILLLVLAIVAACLAWIWLLRRRVRSQTDVIRYRLANEKQLKNEALAASRAKGHFLANMSHEIRTPLTAILGFSQLLEEEVDDESKELAESIGSAGRRLLDTLDSVLEMARVEGSSVPIDLDPVNASQVAGDVIRSLRHKAEERGISLSADLPAEEEWVFADGVALMRVLTNLLGNAIRFTEEGGVLLTISGDDQTCSISILDTGIGIEADFLPKLFQPFIQASQGPGRRYEGTGLGLSIAKGLVEKMNGAIHVQSKVGEGSVFTVTLHATTAPDSTGDGFGSVRTIDRLARSVQTPPRPTANT